MNSKSVSSPKPCGIESNPHLRWADSKEDRMGRFFYFCFLVLMVVASTETVLAYDNPAIERLIRTRTCEGCAFYRANFNQLDLTGVNLKNAYLAYATFRKTTLYKADLTGADLKGADFSGALWVDGSVCQFGSVGRCIKSTGD